MPSLGLLLFSRWQLAPGGSWCATEEPAELSAIHPKSFAKSDDRLRLFSRPQFSVQTRAVAFNTFIQSVMLYATSYLGITSRDFNKLRQSAVKFVLRRHWLEAEIMPYVLKVVGVATITDPGLAATVAALGLYLPSPRVSFPLLLRSLLVIWRWMAACWKGPDTSGRCLGKEPSPKPTCWQMSPL